jgi:hypothetical protein
MREELHMGRKLEQLIERARKVRMSEDDVTAQRRSFAYGNAGFENPNITRQMVDEADDKRETRK